MKIKLRNNFAFSLIMTFVLIIMFGSCGKKAAPPQISDIKLDATRLRVGKANVVYVDIISNPSSLSLKFDWSTSNGTISTGSTKVTYTPGREGESSISLKVVNSKNDRILITKEFPLTIAPSVSQVDVITNFVFAGFMGDGERFGARAIALDDQYTENPYSLPTCVQIKCRNLPGSIGWSGIYAQYNVGREGENWGDYPGMDLSGYTKLTFHARGENGGEMVEFKAGGIKAPGKRYKDSFEYTMGTIKLTTNWTRYEMDLSEEDLSSVIGGFCAVVTSRSNPNGLTFYVDSITYE